ncbi:lipoyl(octanoyl) transferase LipB [Desulfobulbus alkaliphilus]|uniref:lipoyl(octanoyl) transferase LipB n=1 Tax=Desulfobulbus alkaliphilus TaxID=869814 RepID=UPI003084153A
MRTCVFQDLQVLEYRRALDLQVEARNAKIQDRSLPDQLFFVQHPPVFTFGKRGGKENLVKSEFFLEQQGIDMVQTDRGGNITYHGPGQAVLYPVVDLERACIGVADFVYGLEEIMGRTAEDFGVAINRDPRNRGMWKGSRKIGSVGLSIKRRISIHGLALNVSLDLTPFSWINPCGLSRAAMTSLQQELQISQKRDLSVSMDAVKEKFVTYFCRLFHFQLTRETIHA